MSTWLNKVFGSVPAHTDQPQGDPQQQQQQQSSQMEQQQGQPLEGNFGENNQNNQHNDLDIWQTTQQQQQGEEQQQVGQPQEQPANPQEVLNNHIQSLNLLNGVDINGLTEAVAQNNPEGVQQVLQQVSANAYLAAVKNTNELVNAKLEKLEERFTQQAQQTVDMTLARQELQTKLPYTTDKNIAPIAVGALKSLLNQGLPLNQAIEGVQGFFEGVARTVNPNGIPPNNLNMPNSRRTDSMNFNNNNTNQQQSPQSHDDWVEFLSSK